MYENRKKGDGEMSSYNFNETIERLGTASVKWEATEHIFGTRDVLPMWVADMDFRPPTEVTEAFARRIEHGIYGYTFVPPSTVEAIQSWVKKRHNWEIKEEWISYSPSVVQAISTAIQAYTGPGDKILVTSPVYTPFFNMIEKNDRMVENCPLHINEERFAINFELLEQSLKKGVKLFLLCNPHNPGGRVWSKEELQKIGDLCLQYNCLILADEIHCDLVFKPNKHIPIASINERFQQNVITCMSPSKTFNLAGIHASVVIIPNEELKQRFAAIQERQGFFELNSFGIIGMEAAFRYGEAWLDELIDYLHTNMTTAMQFIQEQLANISVMKPDGTYLLWVDCRKLGLTDEELRERLLQKGKIALEPGPKYGPGGEGFIRMNIACPTSLLLEGLNRLKNAFS